jgi:hypothetical protein
MPFATRPYAARPDSAWRRFPLTRNAGPGAHGLTGAVATTLLALTTTLALGQSPSANMKVKAEMLSARAPMSFEPNRGQISSPEVQYLAHGARYGVGLTARGAMLSLDAGAVTGKETMRRHDRIGLDLPGGNPRAIVTAENALTGRMNYFIGNDPKKWHTDVPTYGRVRYASVYPGVDLVYYGNQGRLEYDFVVAPHAESNAIGLRFRGARALKLDARGNLTIQAANGAIVFEKPTVYQNDGGRRVPVEGSFRLEANNTVGFKVGRYDHSRTLVIDPVLAYSTYLGGSTSETIASTVVDGNGSLYVTGTTFSTDFPTSPGVAQPTAPNAGAGLAFITKFGPNGNGLVYSSFLGGTSGKGSSHGFGIVVDPNNSIYVVGATTATDFPVGSANTGMPAFQMTNPEGSTGNSTGFVFRLNAPGNGLLYSTYLGGSGGAGVGDSVSGIALDAAGDAVVVGATNSANFPTTAGAYQKTSPNPNLGVTATSTGFVASVIPNGTALKYATYLGGSGKASLSAVALDSSGNAYVVGNTSLPTNSTNYPTTGGAFQTTNSSTGTGVSGVVTKLNPTGTALVYSTFLGANGTTPTSIALDASGNAYIGGYDLTGGFPATGGAYQTTWTSGSGFIASLKAAGNALNYGTFLSGAVFGLGVESSGIVDATGSTTNKSFPMSPDALQIAFPTVDGYNPATAAFVVRLNAGGATANYSSYFSGSSYTSASALAVDANSNVYLGGQTCATDLPVSPTAYQTTKFSQDCSATGGFAGFAAKFSFATPGIPTNTVFTGPVGQVQFGVATTLTATTAPSNAPGTVNFLENGKVFGSAPLVNGTAYLTNQMLPLGTHTITAVYTGDLYYAESTSDPVSFTVVSALTVNFSPTSLTFPTISVNSSSASMSAQIVNSGSTPVTLYSLGMTGDFTETDNCPISVPNGLPANSSCGVTIVFTPSGTGVRTGSASLISSISTVPQVLGLTGTGTAPTASLSAISATFADTTVGTTSQPTAITLTNTGVNGALTISSIVASSNLLPDEFAQTNNCGTSLAPNASCVITITFIPGATGARTGKVVITDNSSTGTTQTITLNGNGVNRIKVTAANDPLTFGLQAPNTTSAAQTITITNLGTGAVPITSVAASGDFAQTNTCGTSLPGNGTCTISVTFTPTVATGNRTGAITITDGAVGSPHTVGLTGTVAAAVAVFTPTALTFDGQLTGSTSAVKTVALSNTGNTALVLTSIAASGNFAQTNNCGTSVAVNASCTISVTFTPTATGARTGAITVTDNASGSPHSVSLTGTGIAPVGSISPNSLTFASQPLNTTSVYQTVTLSNTGTAPLNVNSVAITGAFALNNNTCGSSVAAGASCTIQVTFTPTVTGTSTGTLTVADSASGSPRVVSLTGNGIVPVTTVTFTPSLLTYTTQNTGTTSTAQTVTLTNTGSATLTVISVTTTGDFAQTNTCGTSVAAGAKCTIAVTFSPTADGTRTGLLTIGDNATNSPQIVSLTGTGFTPTPVVVLTPPSLTFTTQNTGTTSTAQTVTLKNTGTLALTLTSILASGDFTQTNTCGTSVSINASCTISVTFKPTASGTRTGAITLTDNAKDSPQTVILTGTAITPAPVVSLSPGLLTFTAQNVGSTATAKSVALSNTGNAALTLTSIVASGDFAQTNNCGTSVAVGASCTITVTFTPTAGGTRTGAITLKDNAADSPQTVTLTGTGVALVPVATFSLTSLTFGTQQVGSTSSLRSISLTNTGAANLTISSIAASGDFTQVNSCSTGILVPGTTCTISISFTPTAAGTRTGAITVTDNAANSPQTVTLTGTGVVPSLSVAFAPPALTFAKTTTGTTTAVQSTIMTNTGATALSISSISVSGDYAMTNNCGSSLPANGSCRISVTFTPTSGGTRAGLITVLDNAPNSPQTVALTGVGEGISITSTVTTTGLNVAGSGGSATTTLQLGSNTFSGLVYLTCSVTFTGTGTASNLPACSLNPPSQTVTAGSATQSIVLTVTTGTASAKNVQGHSFPWTPAGASLATLLLMGWISPRKRRGIRLLTVLLAVVLGGLAGCAGGANTGTTSGTGTTTTSGNYAVKVTAANGGTAASVTIPVKVQ